MPSSQADRGEVPYKDPGAGVVEEPSEGTEKEPTVSMPGPPQGSLGPSIPLAYHPPPSLPNSSPL